MAARRKRQYDDKVDLIGVEIQKQVSFPEYLLCARYWTGLR